MLGVGSILMINAVFTDLNFFDQNMPNARLDFLIPIMLNVPQILGQLFSIKYLSQVPIKALIITMTLICAVICVLLPVFVATNAKLALTLVAMGYFGIFMAIINSAMIGYVSLIKNPKAMSVYMVGCSTNSQIVIVISVICIFAFDG